MTISSAFPCMKIYELWTEMLNKMFSLRWRHNDHDGVSIHQPHHCLLNRLFGRRSKKTSKLRVTGHCAGKSPETGEFPAQMASNAENVSIWWRHHVIYRMRKWVCVVVVACHYPYNSYKSTDTSSSADDHIKCISLYEDLWTLNRNAKQNVFITMTS